MSEERERAFLTVALRLVAPHKYQELRRGLDAGGLGVAIVTCERATISDIDVMQHEALGAQCSCYIIDLGQFTRQYLPSCRDSPGGVERAKEILMRSARPGTPTAPLALLTACRIEWCLHGEPVPAETPGATFHLGIRPQEAQVRVYEFNEHGVV